MNASKFHPRRRLFLGALAGAGTLLVAGCDKLSKTEWFPKLLGNTEILTRKAQRLILPRKSMAQEFPESDRSPEFRSNGTAMPNNPQYKALASSGFAAYGLEVGGLVEKPVIFSLEDLRALLFQVLLHDQNQMNERLRRFARQRFKTFSGERCGWVQSQRYGELW